LREEALYRPLRETRFGRGLGCATRQTTERSESYFRIIKYSG